VAFSAVLDANVLYPFSLRDTLLRLAELELFWLLRPRDRIGATAPLAGRRPSVGKSPSVGGTGQNGATEP
jgi:hypothetical protein